MKATLEFNLPEDQEAYDICHKAMDMYSALDEIRQFLRNKCKYTEEVGSFEEVREEFHSILISKDLDIP